MIRLMTLVAVATALIVAVSGCGGSKKSSASSSTSTTSGSNSSSSSSGGQTVTVKPSTDTTGSSSGSSANLTKDCLNFSLAASKLAGAAAASGSASADAKNAEAYFAGLADKAPSNIKDAFKTFAGAMTKYVDTLKGMNLKAGSQPSAADLAKLQQAAAALSTPEVKAASAKIQAWVKSGCHS